VDNLPSRYLDFVAQSYAFDSVQRRERKQRNKVTSQVLLWIDVVATELFILSQLCLRVHKRTAVESIAVSMVRSLFFLSKTAHKKYVVTGFDSRWRLGIFLCDTMSRPALGPIQPPIQWVLGALSLGVKRPGREADHSPPSSAEVNNAQSYTSTPPVRLNGVVLS